MERKLEGLAERSKNYEQYKYDSMVTRSEGLGPANQRLLQVPSSTVGTIARPPELNVSGTNKPVLNYSIRTGEEFALEFMQERANSRKPPIPNAAGDQENITTYTDLKGILGITHIGSESGSDASMLIRGEKGPGKEFEKKGSYHYQSEEKAYHESAQSVLRSPSGDGSSRGAVHGYISSGASDSSLAKLKILCSFGGKILPRPRDGKLRYVGGDTRIIRISKDISWQELMQKASKTYSQAHTIKYQLPGEDLDALVSVSCDEDLQNMMEECSVLEGSKGSQKLRMFLFSAIELDDAHSSVGSLDGNSEIQYFVAVNGMDSEQEKNGDGLGSMSANDLDRLHSPNIGGAQEASRFETESVAPPFTGILLPPSSTPMQESSLNYYGTQVQPYQGQITHYAEGGHYPILGVHPPDSYSDVHGGASISSFTPLQYGYNSHYALFGESSVPLPLHEPVSLPQGGLSEGLNSGFRPKDLEVSANEVTLKVEGPIQQKNEVVQNQFLQKEVVSSMQQHASSVPKNIPAEVSLSTPPPERGTSLLPSRYNGDILEPVRVSTPPDAVNASQSLYSNDDDHYITSEGDPADFSCYEPPLHTQRVFQSESIPREQMESLNRLSKSDDNIGSQYLKTHLRPSLVPEESITESVEPLHEGNLVSHADQSFNPEKPLYTSPPTIEDGLTEFEKYKELANAIMHMNKNKPIFAQEGMDSLQFVHHGPEEDSNDGEMTRVKAHLKEPRADKVAGPEIPSAGPGAGIKLQEDPASGLPDQGDILIDINDRFPPDLLSDIFSMARISDDPTVMSPLNKDEAGLSLNMQNHEPQNWSFFRNLAPDEFGRKDVSLMDQDHIVFHSPHRMVEEGAAQTYRFSPLKSEGVTLGHLESQVDLNEDIMQQPEDIIGADTSGLHPDFIYSQVIHSHLGDKGSQGLQVEDTSFSNIGGNQKTPDLEYEEGRLEAEHNDGRVVDSSLVDIGFSDLQIIKNEDLEELKELGSGTFGTVYHGKWRGTDVAIKRIKKSCFAGRSSEQERLTVDFWREAEIISRLHHPNVVAFYGVVQDGPGGTLATVAEFMVNGSLRHVLLRKDKYLDRRKRLIIAMDAAFGMEYLHSKNIVHFDLKCDNLLVNLKDPLRPICKVDVFSFGIVMWEILTGEEPYANMHYGAIIGGIVSNTLRPPVPNFCDPEWRRLMEQCWAPDPMARPSFTEIVSRFRLMSTATQSKAQNQGTK
ncbi:uncharacterized protein LOC131242065 isoform X2 [Magnolia sinica]|uniref:uncharacterized protein LOC131242065 isoform X2 n=1 Tax=Magnolia sinica TaxID=86752 RepID=UPI0026585BFC|nr:uncharacterized protein LOC131242065 isoform X2 [Magnolia sinica]